MSNVLHYRAGVAVLGLMFAAGVAAQTVPAPNTINPTPSPAAAPPAAAAPAVAAPLPGPMPAKSDTAMEAFNKLNRRNAGYLTPDDVAQLEGFGSVFAQADQNGDGRLNPAEFNSAWALYTGNAP